MDIFLKDHEVRNFANDLISKQFIYNIVTKQISLPHYVDENSLLRTNSSTVSSSSAIDEYLRFLGSALRDFFHPAFARVFPSCVKDETSFMKYTLSFCNQLYHHCAIFSHAFQSRNVEYRCTYFLLACSFIAEFALFCFRLHCYRYACTAKNCILAVYYRYFNKDLCTKQGLLNLESMCKFRLMQHMHVAMAPINTFVHVALNGDSHLFDCMVLLPVKAFVQQQLEKALELTLTIEETNYIQGGYLCKRDRDPRLPSCEYCGYGCITHLKMLLLIKFSFY